MDDLRLKRSNESIKYVGKKFLPEFRRPRNELMGC